MCATNEATSPVLQEINKKLIAKGNVRIVGNFYRGARQLSARYAVHSPKDMQGKKFRSVPVPLWTSMIKGMGAIPTPVEISEIMPALMTGLVDGQENPLNNIIARKMWEANKYVMMTSPHEIRAGGLYQRKYLAKHSRCRSKDHARLPSQKWASDR